MAAVRKGFVLPDVTVGMAIAAVVGLCVVGVSAALCAAYAHSQDFYQSLQTGRIAMMRMQAMLRKAKLVTCVDGSVSVLWAGDANGNGRINLDEIRLLSYVLSSREIQEERVRFPDSMPPETVDALNVEVPLQDMTDLDALAPYLVSPNLTSVVLAGDVEEFEVSATPVPPVSKLLKVSLTISGGRRAVTLRSAVSLRADVAGDVGISDGCYVLN